MLIGILNNRALVTGEYKGLQGVTEGYKGLQGGYNRLINQSINQLHLKEGKHTTAKADKIMALYQTK